MVSFRFACFGGFVSVVSFRFACFGGFVSFYLFQWFRFGGFVLVVQVATLVSFCCFGF